MVRFPLLLVAGSLLLQLGAAQQRRLLQDPMLQQGMPQQGMPQQMMQQGMPQQMPQQGMPQQLMQQEGIPLQEIPQDVPAQAAGTLKETDNTNLRCRGEMCLFLTAGTSVGFVPPGAPPGTGGALLTPPQHGFPNLFAPTLPASEVDVLRVLWERATGVLAEVTGVDLTEDMARLDPQTGAYVPRCSSPVHMDECPGAASRSAAQPALVAGLLELKGGVLQTLDPRNADAMTRADVIVKLVRNPLDHYGAIFAQNNAKFLQTNDVHDINWKVDFKTFMEEVWVKHVSMPTALPQFIVRLEDLVQQPEHNVKELIVATQSAKYAEVDVKKAGEAAKRVETNVGAVGDHFGVALGEAVVGLYPDVFQGRLPTGEVEGVIASVVKDLMNHQDLLSALGYVYYSPSLTGQPLNLLTLEQQHKEVRRAVRATSYEHAGAKGGKDPDYTPGAAEKAQKKFAHHQLEENIQLAVGILGISCAAAVGHCLYKMKMDQEAEWQDKRARATQRLQRMGKGSSAA